MSTRTGWEKCRLCGTTQNLEFCNMCKHYFCKDCKQKYPERVEAMMQERVWDPLRDILKSTGII
jgi:hypothetical protein